MIGPTGRCIPMGGGKTFPLPRPTPPDTTDPDRNARVQQSYIIWHCCQASARGVSRSIWEKPNCSFLWFLIFRGGEKRKFWRLPSSANVVWIFKKEIRIIFYFIRSILYRKNAKIYHKRFVPLLNSKTNLHCNIVKLQKLEIMMGGAIQIGA